MLAAFVVLSVLAPAAVLVREVSVPVVKDPELELSLFAAEPTIVTPIGIAIDKHGRIFIVESHTHRTRPDYPGPKHDRIKLLQDTTGDGRPDRVSVFADALPYAAMNLRFDGGGRLYLSHRDGVVILHDNDGDGVCDARTTVLELDTPEKYPHNAIGGIEFSPDGWLYVGLGENLSQDYTLRGRDGSSYSGGGEGGNIFRCRPDGSKLQYVATGFWNPFDLKFDGAGHLFCVDNDPDACPPCRLLHIVPHGDYGYKRRFGRSGLHPFVAWNGELPGTLPMVAGTGEAPSGILDCDDAQLPRDYHGALLVTSWGDHTIERYRPRPHGASPRAEREIIVQGDESFWPVGIAAAPDGSVYITDWADKEYPVHEKGRVWRLRAKPGVDTPKPPARSPARASNPEMGRMHRLLDAVTPSDYARLAAGVADADPFIQVAAVSALARPVFRSRVLADIEHEKPEVRLGALLALRRGKHEDPVPVLRKCLADPDDRVRLMALVWIGEDALVPLAGDIDKALSAGAITPRLFQTYMAVTKVLVGHDAKTGKARPIPTNLPGPTGASLIEEILGDGSKPATLRAMAAAMVADPDDEKLLRLLLRMMRSDDPEARVAAVRTLAASRSEHARARLGAVARRASNPADLRAEAILALANQSADGLAEFVGLLDDPQPVVRIETVRALRRVASDSSVRKALQAKLTDVGDRPADRALAEQLRFALYPPGVPSDHPDAIDGDRPTSDAQWRAVLARGGDAKSGRRVFFHPTMPCSTCHRLRGRGGHVGPDLSIIARSADREKLITSILTPSQNIAPLFVQYVVWTKSNEVRTGLLAGRGADGSITLTTADAETVTIPADDIDEVRRSALSIMPEDLESALTVQDFRDLLAFLLTLK